MKNSHKKHSPLFHFLKSIRLKTWIALGLLFVLAPIVLLSLFKPQSGLAAWMDDTWAYRATLTFTHNANVSDTKVRFDIATDALITAGKMQADCGDSRFTDINGKVLEYYIDTVAGACNTSATAYYVLIPSIINGTNVLYHYYGNPTVVNGTKSEQFSQSTTSPNGGAATTGSEQKSNGPVIYYKMDQGSDNMCSGGTNDICDARGTTIDGAISNGTAWKNEDFCISGKCLYFDGTDDIVTTTQTSAINLNAQLSGGFTFEAWIKPNSAGEGTGGQIFYKGTNSWLRVDTLSAGSLDVEASLDLATTDATLNVSTAVKVNQWTHVALSYTDDADDEITIWVNGRAVGTSTNGVGSLASDTNDLLLGGTTTNNFKGFIDEVKLYNYERSTAQMTTDAINGSTSKGNAAIFGQVSNPSINNGLIGYWKMDESTWGTPNCSTAVVLDSSGNANNGTACPNTTGPTGAAAGKFGYGGLFDGSDDNVDIGNTIDLSGNTPMSVSAWVYPTSAPGANGAEIISKYDRANAGEWRLILNSARTVQFLRECGGFGVTSSGTISLNTWSHVEGTYNGTNLNIYINGILDKTVVDSCSVSSTAIEVMIGAGDNAATAEDVFTGNIDEARIYNRAQTATEVNQLYNWAPGPVGYWRMDYGTGSTTYDNSGNSNTGTLSGTTIPEWVNGKFGSSLNFNGSTSYVNAGNGSSLQITNNITLSAWVNLNANNAVNDIVSRNGASGSYNYRLYSDATGKLAMEVSSNGTAVTTVTGSSTLSTGTWYHVTGVYIPGTSLTVYINGVQDGQNTTSIPSAINNTSSVALNIGTENNGSGGTNAAAFVQECNNYGGTISSLTINCNTTAGNLLVLMFQSNTGSSRTYAISDTGGNTWTLCASCEHRPGGIVNTGELYYTLATSSNTSVTITITGGTTNVIGAVAEFSGISASPLDKSVSSFDDTGSTSMTSTATAATTQANEVVVGHLGVENTGTITGTGTGWTYNTTHNGAASISIATGYKILTATGAQTNTGTAGTSGRWTASAATFKANSNPVNVMNGKIDEAKVYNYSRTPSQIIEDMNAGHPSGGSPIGSEVIKWAFDEGQGTTANNQVTGGANGTLSGIASPATTTSGWTFTGKNNKAIIFDGTDDKVVIATASDANVDFNTAEPFSVCSYVYPTTMAGSSEADLIVGKWDATTPTRGYRLYLTNDDADTTGNFRAEVYDESTDQTISAAASIDTVSVNTWYHVCMTFNGGVAGTAGDLKLYVNGANLASSAANASFLGLEDVTADFTVGDYDATDVVAADTAFTGTIDDVQVYAGLLTSDQIKIVMNANAAINFGSTSTSEVTQITGTAETPPVGRWKFDENTGQTTQDSSGNENTGTLGTSAGVDTTDPVWTNGRYGASLGFDGTTMSVDVPDSSVIDVTDGNSFSLSVWVRRTGNANSNNPMAVVSKRNAGSGGAGYELTLAAPASGCNYAGTGNDGICLLVSDGTDTYEIQTGAVLTADSLWHHIQAVYDDGTAANNKIYLDGKQQTVTLTGTLANVNSLANAVDLCVGKRAVSTCATDTNNAMNGSIDDLRIYNYARTQAQAVYEYNRGGPVGWWKFDDCSGSTAYDSSGNGNNATLTYGGGTYTQVGTCTSGTSSDAWYGGAVGKFNGGIALDTNTDTISVGNISAYSFERTNPFSTSIWFKTTSDSNQTLLSKQDSSAPFSGWNIQTGTLGILYFQLVNTYSSNTLEMRTGDTGYSDGLWHNMIATYDGSSSPSGVHVYFDGKEKALTTGVNTLSASILNSISVYIGSRNGSAQRFSGLLDDVRIYNYALTLSQMKKLYNEGSSVRFGPLTGTPSP